MNRYFKHFKTVCKHKWFVFKACRKAGIVWRGITHDNSKFTPTEFLECSRYYTGTSSPINRAKEEQGVSYAWLHHKGRNPHHWEYWVDNISEGGKGRPIPYKYALELICDYIGAGQTYEGDNWTFDRPYDYWIEVVKPKAIIERRTSNFIECIFWTMKVEQNYNALDSEYTKSVYESNLKGWVYQCFDW